MTATTTSSKAVSGALAATCLSTLVVNANTSAVSILLPAISEDTGMSVSTLQWAVTALPTTASGGGGAKSKSRSTDRQVI